MIPNKRESEPVKSNARSERIARIESHLWRPGAVFREVCFNSLIVIVRETRTLDVALGLDILIVHELSHEDDQEHKYDWKQYLA